MNDVSVLKFVELFGDSNIKFVCEKLNLNKLLYNDFFTQISKLYEMKRRKENKKNIYTISLGGKKNECNSDIVIQ
jgi:hypothetical protein